MIRSRDRNKLLPKNNVSSSDETVQSFRSWIRKLEQTTNSLSSRLIAVEKRISARKNDIFLDSIADKSLKGPIERLFRSLDEQEKDIDIKETSVILDQEFVSIQEELSLQMSEITDIKQKIEELNISLKDLLDDVTKGNDDRSNTLDSLNTRVERIEVRVPPALRFGKMEIPIEVTGIVGGLLAFILAILVSVGQGKIIVSPIFLSIVGFILIGSVIFKTMNVGLFFDKIFKKHDKILAKVEENS